jgi:hypothetical protein
MPLGSARIHPLLAAALLTICLEAAAQSVVDDAWSEESRGDGWVLYTRDVAGSTDPGFRLVSRTDKPVEEVFDAMKRKIHDERYLTKGYRRTVLASGDDYLLTHLFLDVPFVTDRVLVQMIRWSTDPVTGVHRVTWEPAANERPDLDEGGVPMQSRGFWEFTPLPDGGTGLVYEQYTELGGWVPGWLIARGMNPEIVNELTILLEILDESPPSSSPAPGHAPATDGHESGGAEDGASVPAGSKLQLAARSGGS